MTTQGGRTAVLDGRHHLELAQAQMPGIGTAPGGAMLTKDVGDLQPRAAHRRRARLRVSASPRAAARAGCGPETASPAAAIRRGAGLPPTNHAAAQAAAATA